MDNVSASPVPDAAFERFARLVRDSLGVPIALVSLHGDDEQVFPGCIGLPEPWQSTRRTPLSHSLCQYVFTSGRPLVTTDARCEPELATNPAIAELGVIGYAGMPLTDGRRAVGSLCAIDTAPRAWTGEELAFLSDLAAACSSELALRVARRDADEARAEAGVAAVRAQLLLALSEALTATTTVDDVITTTIALAEEHLGATDIRVTTTTAGATPPPGPTTVPGQTGSGEPALVRAALNGASGRLGKLVLRPAGPPDHALLEALAGYTSAALERAQLLQERRDAATTLQLALLPRLPTRPAPGGLTVQARYVPAAHANQVGGDWYDVVRLPGNILKVVIGDVVGHDIEAAARMGQLRSSLRTLSFDRGESPAAILTRLDDVILGLDLDLAATTQIAYLTPDADGTDHDGPVQVTWSSAGHPAPLVISPDGTIRVLTDPPDLLLGIMTGTPRHDHHITLEAGATLLMYTDGLLERRGRRFSEGQDALIATLTQIAATGPTHDIHQLLDTLVVHFLGPHAFDDCAILAVHNPVHDHSLSTPSTHSPVVGHRPLEAKPDINTVS